MKSSNLQFSVLFLFFAFTCLTSLSASQIEVKDTINVNTIWNVDTVKITGDLFLPAEDSLVILPGTCVEFQGNYSIKTEGVIIAIGAVNDSIVFTVNDTTGFHNFSTSLGGWKLIQTNSYTSDQINIFEYCIFEYGKNTSGDLSVIDMNYGSQYRDMFHHNSVRYCYAKDTSVIAVSQAIFNCDIRDNYSNAFQGRGIQNSLIRNNNGNGAVIISKIGSHSEDYSEWGQVINCTISKNNGWGIILSELYYDVRSIEILKNHIKGNWGGISVNDAGSYIENNSIGEQTQAGAINLYNIHGHLINNLICENQLLIEASNDSTQSVINIVNSTIYLFSNNTIYKNIGIKGGGSFIKNTPISIKNNIYWNNQANQGGDAIYVINTSPTSLDINVHSNDIKNGLADVYTGPNVNLVWGQNLNSYPEFVDTTYHDFSIASFSPCVDTGTNFTLNCNSFFVYREYYLFDLKKNYRTFNNKIDIGAFEFIPDSVYFYRKTYGSSTIEFCEEAYKSIYLLGPIPFERCYTNKPFQWQKDGIDIEGETSNDFYLKNISKKDAGKYNSLPPSITWAYFEYNIVVIDGKLGEVAENEIILPKNADTTLTLRDLEALDLNFAWYKDGNLLADTTESLTLNQLKPSDAGYYYCHISSACHDSYTDSLHLTLLDTVIHVTTCMGYNFNGSYLVSSGNYYDTLPKLAGGDSLILLNLKILEPTSSILDVNSCDTYSFLGQQISESGTYSDTIPNAAGCDSIITLNLIITKVETSVTVSDSGYSATLPDAEYQWINCADFSLIADATNQVFEPAESGNYGVIVANEGCSDTSDCYHFVVTDLGDISLEEDIAISPNPLENSTTISLRSLSYVIREIRLINMIGEEVFSANKIYSNTFILNKSDLKPGNYFAIISSDSKVWHRCIIVK